MTLRRAIAILGAFVLTSCGAPRVARHPGANVLFVTLDTTRADHVGAWGDREARTPAIDSLAREGTRFAKEYSSVPLTLPAHSTLMTGRSPVDHGVRDNGGYFLDDRETTLAEVLKGEGYRTAAFVSAFVLNHHWGIAQGFDVYDDAFGPDDPQEAADLHAQRDGKEATDRAIAWLDAHRDGKFFAWVHLYDPHWPYEHSGYDGEIAYADSQVGRLLSWLKGAGLERDTLVVVTADHGEGLGEHGEPDHGIFAYDSTLHVPLVMRGPGIPEGRVVESVSRDVDVMPTILDYLGVPVPDGVRGASLLLPEAGRPAYAETYYARLHYGWKEVTTLREGRFKLVDLPTPELYDLDADPGEVRNLADAHPERVAEMRSALSAIRREPESAPAETDPETLAKLLALGYVGSAVRVEDGNLPDPKSKLRELDLLVAAARATADAMRSGKLAEATATVERALAVEPRYLDGWQFLGTLYARQGRPDEAIAALKRVLDANPGSIAARMGLARAHASKGEHDAAAALADAVLADSPRYVAAYYVAAEELAECGRFDDAIARLRRLVQERPDAVIAPYEIARVMLRAGRYDAAEAQIRKALEVEPRLRSAHFNLALLAERRGDRDGAEREYEAEVERFPDHAEAWANLGILRMQRGEKERGVDAFERLVAVAPDDPRARALLARARLTRSP